MGLELLNKARLAVLDDEPSDLSDTTDTDPAPIAA